MTMLAATQTFTDILAAGKRLTVAVDSGGSAMMQRFSGNEVIETLTIGSGITRVFGEYFVDQNYRIDCLAGEVTITEAQSTDSVKSFSTDTSGNVTGLVGQNGMDSGIALRPYVDGIGKNDFFPDGQPYGVTKAVRQMGTLVDIFRDATKWATLTGTPTKSNVSGIDASGVATSDPVSRTGVPSMLKIVLSSSNNVIQWSNGTGFPATSIAGKLGFWIYLPTTNSTSPSAVNIGLASTTAFGDIASFNIGFTANQLRPGWNFIKMVKTRDPVSNSDTEQHFFGMTETITDYTKSAIFSTSIKSMRIQIEGLAANDVVYFESCWTDFTTKAQVVLGCDAADTSLMTYAKPIFDTYGWVGYTAIPRQVNTGAYGVVTNWKNVAGVQDDLVRAKTLYDAGWDTINHSMNHKAIGGYTNTGEIYSEIQMTAAWYKSLGMTRGSEFYASPTSSTSVLAEKVIRDFCKIKLQRHAKKQNTSVTPWGLDNTSHIGAVDMGSTGVGLTNAGMVRYSRMKAFVDMLIRYGDTGFMFWHFLTTLGDDGTGESDGPLDGLTIPVTNFTMLMAYIREQELADNLTVCKGITGFYYGVDYVAS